MDPSAIDFAEVPRSRLRRPLPDTPTHSDSDISRQPLYSGQNEFTGGSSIYPPIVINEITGKSRPPEQRDYEKKPFAASETRAASEIRTTSEIRATSETRNSEEVSSVHKVLDLGFSAAADGIPNSLHHFNNIESLKSEALAALDDRRKLFRSSDPAHATSYTSMELELRKKVGDKLNRSSFDKKEYLSLDAFEATFDVRSIIWLLAEKYPQAVDEELWSRFTDIFDPSLQKSRRRILGILVFMKSLTLIEGFIRENIWDGDLPFKYPNSHSGTTQLMKDWDRNDIDLFYMYQEMFFVPYFNIQDQKLLSYDLDRDIRLPFQKFERKTSGGTGIVHQVEIHPSHHSFRRPGTMKPVFALKEIDAMDERAYNEELTALEKACAKVQKEKHLIKLLLTFRHGEKFYLLFEWADGSLERFWESEVSKSSVSLTERWAAEQCLGLARAVSRIHGLRTWQKEKRSCPTDALCNDEREWGRHGDIKPENILWFKEYEGDHNLLVISDLGLTRYHTRFSRSLVHRSQIDGCTQTYRPPELDMGSGISQLYDIWSLGCVFLEFCIWYLQGYEEVQLFASQRMDDDKSTIENVEEDKFFLMNGDFNDRRIPELKPSVIKQIAILRDQPTKFTNGLLNVIEDKMLCCDPQKRSPIDKICTDLLEVLNSLPKATIAEDISQAGAFVRVEDSILYPPSLSDISQDESSNWTLESPGTSMINGRDSAVVVPARSETSRQEEVEQDSHHEKIQVLETTSDTVELKAIGSEKPITSKIKEIQSIDSSETTMQRETISRLSANNTGLQSKLNQQSLPKKVKHHRRIKSSKIIQGFWHAARRLWS